MKTKHVALLFLYLFCFEYLLGIVAAVAGPYGPLQPSRCCPRKRRQTGCRLTPQLEDKLNDCFERIQFNLADAEELPDQRVEEYELTQGVAVGFRNFQRGPFRCSCGRNLVRIFVRVDFLRILLTFVLNLLDDLLGGLLGTLGSVLSQTLGNVVNLLVRILALRIEVQITILQRFIPGTTCILESYRVSRVFTIRLLGLDLAPVVEILSPLLTPIVNALLQAILNDRVKMVFQREIERMVITQSEVIC